jgi:hypothetical protein
LDVQERRRDPTKKLSLAVLGPAWKALPENQKQEYKVISQACQHGVPEQMSQVHHILIQ